MAHEYYSIYSDGDRHRYASAEFEHAKYAKMVISLLLIVVILNPIFSLFRTDPDVIFEKLTKTDKFSQTK